MSQPDRDYFYPSIYKSNYCLTVLSICYQADTLRLIEEYKVEVIPASDEVERLAMLYTKEGVIPEKYPTDALHIAAVTVAGLQAPRVAGFIILF